MRDDENFMYVPPGQKKKFVNKKKGKKAVGKLPYWLKSFAKLLIPLDLKKNQSTSKDVDESTKPKATVKKTAKSTKAVAKKEESDDEIKPFPDFLGLGGVEEVKQAAPATQAKPAEAPKKAEPVQEKPVAAPAAEEQKKPKAQPKAAAKPQKKVEEQKVVEKAPAQGKHLNIVTFNQSIL